MPTFNQSHNCAMIYALQPFTPNLLRNCACLATILAHTAPTQPHVLIVIIRPIANMQPETVLPLMGIMTMARWRRFHAPLVVKHVVMGTHAILALQDGFPQALCARPTAMTQTVLIASQIFQSALNAYPNMTSTQATFAKWFVMTQTAWTA